MGGQPDPEALAAFGLPEMTAPARDIEVWPENAKTVEVFCRMATQWTRGAMNGKITGMRYEALPIVMRFAGVPRADLASVFTGVQEMERAALECI